MKLKISGGPALFGAYCAVCHGKDGKGAGPMAKSLKTALAKQIEAIRSGKTHREPVLEGPSLSGPVF